MRTTYLLSALVVALLVGCGNDAKYWSSANEMIPMEQEAPEQEPETLDDYLVYCHEYLTYGGDPDNLRREASELYGMYEIKGLDWLTTSEHLGKQQLADLLIQNHHLSYDAFMALVNKTITEAESLITNG